MINFSVCAFLTMALRTTGIVALQDEKVDSLTYTNAISYKLNNLVEEKNQILHDMTLASKGELEYDGVSFFDHESYSKNNRVLTVTERGGERRRLLPHSGVMRSLILRITDSQGGQPKNEKHMLSDLIFGSHKLNITSNQNSMADIYDQCSGGKLLFVPATGPNVVDGVLEITVEKDMTGVKLTTAADWTKEKFKEWNKSLKIEYEAYSLILPSTVPGAAGGLARQGGEYQMYIGGAENSLELLVHEFGHNLGFQHSGIPGGSGYGDNSCMMGCCVWAQQMCFNAAKSWYSGWYSEQGKEGHEELSIFSNPGQFWKGNLVGIDDYFHGFFDENQHHVVTRIGNVFMMFNRKKGVNSDVKAYKDTIVLVEQSGESGHSKVLTSLDTENGIFTYSDYTNENFDLVVKVCEIVLQPPSRGLRITGGSASQSSTANNGNAHLAIDGNKDQNWSGGSVTHTEKETNPWWKWTLDQTKEVERVVIYNRADCCKHHLDNAKVQLYDGDGQLLRVINMGSKFTVKEINLNNVYTVKEVKIQLKGYKPLMLAEVEMFGPTPKPIPDFAKVIAFISGNENVDISCESIPSSAPVGVELIRDMKPCYEQPASSIRPKFIVCPIQQTLEYKEPDKFRNPVILVHAPKSKSWGCTIGISPLHWALNGKDFCFESLESLNTINDCFTPGTLLNPTLPEKNEIIPDGVVLLRDKNSCFIANADVNLFGCPIETTMINRTPEGLDNPLVKIYGNSCSLGIRPRHWAFNGDGFYFQSQESLATVNECFAPMSLLSEYPYFPPMVEPSPAPTTIMVEPTLESTPAPTTIMVEPTLEPTALPEKNEIIPDGVVLLRNSKACFYANADVNLFGCPIETTTINRTPEGLDNPLVKIYGNSCSLGIRPRHWAFKGEGFFFQSQESLATVNKCFAPMSLLSEFKPTAKPIFISTLTPSVVSSSNPSSSALPTSMCGINDILNCETMKKSKREDWKYLCKKLISKINRKKCITRLKNKQKLCLDLTSSTSPTLACGINNILNCEILKKSNKSEWKDLCKMLISSEGRPYCIKKLKKKKQRC